MPEFTRISADEAIAAAAGQAFTDEDGRATVHSVMISGNLLLGADWDLDQLVTELNAAKDIMWFDDFMGHELAMQTTDNRAYKFQVLRPAVSS